MKTEFRKAVIADAEALIDIYNSSFYSDYLKYGECPAYGRTKEMMTQSIIDYPKFLILCDGKPVGCISCKETENGVYEVGCLCVIPEFQGKGIGTSAMEFAKEHYHDWNRFTLVTPADKDDNIRFYTKKCGFEIQSVEMDGNVKVVRFVLERQLRGKEACTADCRRITQKRDAESAAVLACALWPEHTPEEIAKEFEHLLSSDDAAVFLCRKNGRPVGFAQCQLRRDYVEGTETSPVGYLEGVYVKETDRREGIARELVSACEKWAKDQGCTEFASDCELTNLESQAFHQAVGFKEANRIVAYVRKI